MVADKFTNDAPVPILSGDVPVHMPDLPMHLLVNTAQQFKAIGDPLRLRVLNIIRHQPATAKQLADRLEVSPGTMGHHLRVLLEAGLAQIVARRVQRGIVASYYTRTARIFDYDLPPDLTDSIPIGLQLLTEARDEFAEALAGGDADPTIKVSFPHVRLSQERMRLYLERVTALSEEFLNEPPDPTGEIVGLCLALFTAPPYMQASLDEPRSSPEM